MDDLFKNNDFDSRLATFLEGLESIDLKHLDRSKYTHIKPATFTKQDGRKFIRIVKNGESAHCFIDKTTGDVLKPAGWKTPAKHARGNIFDESNGLKSMGPYGPAYLR